MHNVLKKLLINAYKTEQNSVVEKTVVCIILTTGLIYADILTGYSTKFASIYIVLVALVAWMTHKEASIKILILIIITRFLILWYETKVPDFNHSYDYINLLISTLAIILIYIIVLSLKEFVAEVTSNAQNDSLTSLFSRKYINDVMPIILGEMRRHGRLMSIMFLDCDNFKGMNDNFGHAAGDKVLRIIAESILDTIRVGDIPVRLGGDEFIVFFFETSGLQLKAVIDRCVSKLDEEMKNRGWPVTFSVGVVEFHILPENIDDAIAYVDHVMYRAKREGKNRVIYEQNTTLL